MSVAGQAGTLMVIVPDSISDLVSKGELTPRYYNPGSLFRDVHLVLVNDDVPDPATIQHLVGDATAHVHNLRTSPGLFVRTLGWRPRLLRSWAKPAVALARSVQPDLVRCHSAHLNGIAALAIHRALGTPYVVSLHINPDEDLRRHPLPEGTPRQRLALRLSVAMERAVLREAACVVCVYRWIVPYAKRMGARRVEVVYNVLNTAAVVRKTDYALADPPSMLLAGRQFSKKDPRPVIDALVDLPGVTCTFLGRGPLHDELVARAATRGVADRCRFVDSLTNDVLVSTMHEHDIVLSPNDYGGASKVELEAALVGMPIITNRHPIEGEPEVIGASCVTIDDSSVSSWRTAIGDLLGDESRRAALGAGVRAAVDAIAADDNEARYIALYQEVLQHG